jgi:integrase
MMEDRKHLTGLEVDKLLAATQGTRNEARDRCLLLLMFRHGLRVSEACVLNLSQVDTEGRVLHIARLKKAFQPPTPYALINFALSRLGWWNEIKWIPERTPFSLASGEAP